MPLFDFRFHYRGCNLCEKKEKEECKIVLENKRQYKHRNNICNKASNCKEYPPMIAHPAMNFSQKRTFFEFVNDIIED